MKAMYFILFFLFSIAIASADNTLSNQDNQETTVLNNWDKERSDIIIYSSKTRQLFKKLNDLYVEQSKVIPQITTIEENTERKQYFSQQWDAIAAESQSIYVPIQCETDYQNFTRFLGFFTNFAKKMFDLNELGLQKNEEAFQKIAEEINGLEKEIAVNTQKSNKDSDELYKKYNITPEEIP
jgi:hypothetical protein